MAERSALVDFAHGMPKAELHVHLEGTLEPWLARSLAHRNNVSLQLPSETQDASYPFHDLPSFLAVYYGAMSVLRTSTDFEQLTVAYLAKAQQNNVKYAEIFFDPQAHTSRGVPFDEVLSGIRKGLLRGADEFGISAKAILCFLREETVESAMHTLDAALQSSHRDIIVGVGLDSNEPGNPPVKFRRVFQRVRQETGWKITVHCDVDQEDSIEHIRQAIEEIEVDRIDHGTNIVENEGLIAKVIERGIGLTCCPLSNRVVCDGFKGEEMLALTRRGVKVTANSDDPAYFRGYVNDSLTLLVIGSDVVRSDLIQMARNSFEVSWVSNAERDRLLDMVEQYARDQSAR